MEFITSKRNNGGFYEEESAYSRLISRPIDGWTSKRQS